MYFKILIKLNWISVCLWVVDVGHTQTLSCSYSEVFLLLSLYPSFSRSNVHYLKVYVQCFISLKSFVLLMRFSILLLNMYNLKYTFIWCTCKEVLWLYLQSLMHKWCHIISIGLFFLHHFSWEKLSHILYLPFTSLYEWKLQMLASYFDPTYKTIFNGSTMILVAIW